MCLWRCSFRTLSPGWLARSLARWAHQTSFSDIDRQVAFDVLLLLYDHLNSFSAWKSLNLARGRCTRAFFRSLLSAASTTTQDSTRQHKKHISTSRGPRQRLALTAKETGPPRIQRCGCLGRQCAQCTPSSPHHQC